MELIIGLIALVALLVIFDFAALRWGVNTRGAGGDFNQREEWEYYESQNLLV
jgi:hypothetical protein